MKILLELFYIFARIGLFTFGGGYAMISIIEDICVERKKWISHEEMMNMTVIAESTPGPIAVNTAVFVGYKTRGVAGAIVTTLGTVLPSFIVILLLALFFAEVRDNRYVDAAFRAMRPAVVALIVAPLMGLVKGMKWYLAALAAVVAMAVWYLGVSPMYLIGAGVIVGVAIAVYNGRKEMKR